jgi:hypothetical protein
LRAFPLLAGSGREKQQKARKGRFFWHQIGTKSSIRDTILLPQRSGR